MRHLFEQNRLSERDVLSYFAYTCEGNETFSPTEYKMLQGQKNSVFIKCMKMHFNDKEEIIYMPEKHRPLSQMLSTFDEDHFGHVVNELLNAIVSVKDNGFLSWQNINISFDKIFVDPATYKVYLVYIPLARKIFNNTSMFENELRTSLIKLISTHYSESQSLAYLSNILADGTLTLEEIAHRSKEKGSGAQSKRKESYYESDDNVLSGVTFTALDSPEPFSIEITKDEFVIGKKQSAVDGYIPYNGKISRIHCKIHRRGVQYYITDLGSANGTYVENDRVYQNESHKLNSGDRVRLANSNFKFNIK